MQSSIFKSIILNKTACLFTKKFTQSEMRIFLFVAEEFEGGSSSSTRDFSEGENIVLPEENVAQVSSKHNKYQVSFIEIVRVLGKKLLLSNF